MKVWERVLLALYALIVVVISALALSVAAGWTVPLDVVNASFDSLNSRWIIGAVSALLLLLGLSLTMAQFRNPPVAQALVQSTPLGEVRITLQALENMVSKVSRKIKGIRDIKPRIHITPEGVAIQIQATVSPDQNIPLVTGQLQETIKDYVQSNVGIDVLEVRIMIQSITQEAQARVQ
ncbi:MAG: alkaline shock response membrane anchor protein AmaP [Bacillota bacterium]